MSVRIRVVYLAALAGCMVFPSFAETTPYAWWKMDDISDSSVADASGNGRTLRLGSGCSLTNCADVGMAVYFNGTESAWGQTVANVTLPAPGGRTISMWLYRELTDGPLDPSVNKIPFLFTGFSTLYVNWGNGTDNLLTCVGSPASQKSNALKPGRGAWHHVVWTFEVMEEKDPSSGNPLCNLVEYLDGAVVQTQRGLPIPGNLSFAMQFYLGNNAVNGVRPLYGAVKDVRLYDTVLDEADIVRQYADDRNRHPKRIVGLWPMEAFGTSGSDKVVSAEVSRLGAKLLSGDGIDLVDGGVTGKCAYFPNLTSTWLRFKIPQSTPGFSFGMWMRFATNLPDLEKEAVNNKLPHLFSIGNYGRATVEGTYRTLTDNRCHFFDVGTLNDPNDQGFVCPCVTVQKGEWSHFGVTYEMKYSETDAAYAVTPKVYVDGVCVCTGRTQAAAALTGLYGKDLGMCIGNNGQGGNRPFGGWMDDFCFVDGVLDEAGMADLARGLPSVSAGDDFTVAVESARLDGAIGRTGTRGTGPAARTTSAWSLVSAPAGGEGAAFLRADDLQTWVTLPVAGAYVFRLTAQMKCGLERHDEVTVTRVAPAGGSAPTVSVSGADGAAAYVPLALTAVASPATARVSWKCVSGPGAVRFEPAWGAETKATFFVAGAYEIAAVASDGEHETVSAVKTVDVTASDAIDLENGLIGFWPFDLSRSDKVSGSAFAAGHGIDGAANAVFETKGVDGYAARVVGSFYPYIDTGKKNFIGETPVTPPGESYPTVVDRYRSISCWIYHDTSDTNNSYNAVIAGSAYSWGLWYRCQDDDRGFFMYHNSLLDGQQELHFPRPAVDPANRWTHVYAVYDRNTKKNTGNMSALWIDGVKQTPTSGMESFGRSRAQGNEFMIGGHRKDGAGNNGHFTIDGVLRSRTFPGAIDEVRVYDRVLTEAEIRYLAANPVVNLTRPPAVGGEPAEVRVAKRQACEIAVQVNADSYPAGTALTYTWCVVSGDASGLAFADPTARETTIRGLKAGSYVLQLAVSDGSRTVYSAPIPVEIEKTGLMIYLR